MAAETTVARKDFLGHPIGLVVLFTTEMWERFSYYGMRAILIYYMMKYLMFAQDKASTIYGLYTGLIFLTPIFGGMLADRWLGQRKAVILGGIIMAIGEFVLMVPNLFYLGLFLLVCGCGCLKPNISTQVGGLYEQGDHRRDRAFNVFYMGINLGAFFSPLVCGTLGERYGWKWGFFAAGLGMIAGLIIYLFGQKYLAKDNVMKKAAGEVASKDEPLTKEDRSRILALITFVIFNIIFWALYEQQGNTTAVLADANADRMIFGWEMPASWVQSFNPIMILALIPLIDMFWKWQASRNKEPSSIGKMAIGCFMLGFSFLVLIPPALAVDAGYKINILWIALNTLILTVGEIYLSPVGLSLVTKIAPVKMVSMMMGVWFLSNFFGNYLCGFIGSYWEKMTKESFYILLACLAFTAGIGFLITLKPLKRAIGHGREETVDV